MTKRIRFFIQSGRRTGPALSCVALGLLAAFLLATAQAADIARSGTVATGAAGSANAGGAPAGNVSGVPEVVRPNAQARLTVARDALNSVRSMQSAAAKLSQQAITSQATGAGAWNLGRDRRGNSIVVTSGLSTNGLLPDGGVLKDPNAVAASPTVSFVLPGSWTGVGSITQTTTTADPIKNFGSASTSVVNITQTKQQAILNWDKFNVAPDTTLNFDQTLGGADVGNWISFNKIGVTGNPSQILGSLKTLGPKDASGNFTTGGQVYVINPNGIIFGGTAQVNAHAIVASSLPINDNLIARGLLNNPDGQFHFSALALNAGAQTDAFTPLLSETIAPATETAGSGFTTSNKVAGDGNVTVTYPGSSDGSNSLVKGDDYTVNKSSSGQATVSFTKSGLAKVAGGQVKLSYTPSADSYGDVEVKGGAQLVSPTSAERVGGRIALIGPNVTNAGTLSAPDGQVALAAGLQVGMAAHSIDSIQTALATAQSPSSSSPTTSDPSLRGLDFYVGKVTSPDVAKGYSAGTVTNARDLSSTNVVTTGLIQTADPFHFNPDGSPVDAAGSVLLTGKTVNQMGVISSLTTVSFNGRVDLLANYNAVGNPAFDPTNSLSRPFLFDSSDSSGVVTLGLGSLIQIMPSQSLTEKVNSTPELGLALRSEVNLQGLAIHLASNVSDSATAVPADALVAAIRAPNAQVNFLAGSWTVDHTAASPTNQFYFSGGQVYLDRGTTVDVSGTQAAAASVTENIVPVQLRGTELADSPLQRQGALRGQTVQVDLRVHGPWDPSLNDGRGGYTWVGTPVGNASGYVNLVQRTAGELTVSGGTVNFYAGGSVVIRNGAKVDVSGGWIDYAGGHIQTTKVISGGHLYDISQATPDRVYEGIFDGTTTTLDPKWGVTEKLSNQTLLGYDDPGYFQGGNGGKVAIGASSVALDGSFSGLTWSGARQVLLSPAAGPFGVVAKPGEFQLSFQSQYLIGPKVYVDSPMPPNVTFTAAPSAGGDPSLAVFKEDTTGAYALPKQRQDEVDLSADLINSAGFGFVSVDTSDDNLGKNGRKNNVGDFGRIVVSANPTDSRKPLLTFTLSSGALAYYQQQGLTSATASLNLLGANLDLLGGISAPGGTLNFRATNVSRAYADAVSQSRDGFSVLLHPLAGRGTLTLGPSAALNVAGQVVDFRDPDTRANAPLSSVGGKIKLSGYQTEVMDGSTIDVSGGAVVSDSHKISWGSAGELELAAANEQQFFGALLTLPKSYRGVNTTAFALRGFSGSTGGQLSITAPLIQIGGDPASVNSLVLDPLLFGQGGFSRYKITGVSDPTLSVIPALWLGAPTTVTNSVTGVTTSTPTKLTIAPQPLSYRADFTRTGSEILQTFLPEAPFRAPVSLEFLSQGASVNGQLTVGALVVEKDVSIALTPNAKSLVSLDAEGKDSGTVNFLGKILVPGGTVNVRGAKTTTSFPDGGVAPLSTVYLGPTSQISTAGAPLASQDPLGYTVGTILSGGTISVSGNIVAAKGALLDASGATGAVDVSPFQTIRDYIPDTSAAGSLRIHTTIDSDGGTINLLGGESLFSDATLVAKAGGAAGRTTTALGGTLNVDSGIFFAGGTVVSDAHIPSLVLIASGSTLPVPMVNGSTVVGRTVKDAKGNALSPSVGPDTTTPYFGGTLAATSFSNGGFDWLNFAGSVEFSGALSLKAGSGIQVGYGGVTVGGVVLADTKTPSSLTLSAPYVSLGQTFATPGNAFVNIDPTFGAGWLSVTGAKLIDVGNLSLQGIATADLKTAPGGDIRGNGTLEIVGALTLTAGQIYPPSAVEFNVVAYDYTPAIGPIEKGSVEIDRTGAPLQVPLSAGGQLNLYASTIAQNGVLRAPVGQINLGRDATTVSPIPGKSLPVTDQVTLSSGSVTSVSALDLTTGKPLSIPIPYGNNLNGTSWIDPSGTDITVDDPAGRLIKSVSLSAGKVDDQAGSSIDVAGGGDLYAYRWIRGVNGSTDILQSSSASFAVLPGYKATYAPFGAFNNSSAAQQNLSNDAGYTSVDPITKLSRLRPGDSLLIDLNPTDGLGAQSYVLLPARYALLPGAYLVTPKSAVPSGTVPQADGSTLVAGYRYNALNSTRSLNPLYSMWEVAPGESVDGSVPANTGAASQVDVVRLRAQYDGSLANNFFAAVAQQRNEIAPRLPLDGGQLVFAPRETIALNGKVNAQPILGSDNKPAKNADGSQTGRGGIVDIGSPLDILIAGPNTDLSDTAGELVLDTNQLNAFGAESLLIGGIRTSGTSGTTVAVTTNNVVVDNGPALSITGEVLKAGASLTGPDIVLSANRAVALLPGSSVTQSGALPAGAEKLTITGTVKLTPGETVTFASGGAPLTFPNGTGAATNGFVASVSSVVTASDGTTTKFKAGDTIKNLGANSTLTLDPTQAPPGTVLSIKVGNTSDSIVLQSGDGALLRVSSDSRAQVTRSALTLANYEPTGIFAQAGLTADQLGAPSTVLFAGAKVKGGTGSLIVDATGKTAIFSGATFSGKSVSLSSRSVSLAFDDSGGTTGSLLLGGADLAQIQKNGATSLSLLSYSSIDLYGSGTVGGAGLEKLALHTPQLRGMNGGSVTFQANAISLDNPTTGSPVATGSALPAGSLVFSARALNGQPGIIQLGSDDSTGTVRIDLFDTVRFSAESGVLFAGSGGVNVLGSDLAANATTQLFLDTPLITATAGSRQTVLAGGAIELSSPNQSATEKLQGGLGASLSFRGKTVVANTRLFLPSGTLNLTATGDISIGGPLDVSGQAKTFIDVVRYTGGGQINLTSDQGDVIVTEKGTLDVSAALDVAKNDGRSRVGDAGTLTIRAADPMLGQFVSNGGLKGFGGTVTSQDHGYTPGLGGSFVLDVGSVPDLNLDPQGSDNRTLKSLNAELDAGGFLQERSLRVRRGNVVVDGSATVHTFNLSADQGSITVTGRIDASGDQGGTVNLAGRPSDAFGNRGGSITLSASGSVVLADGAELTVAAADFNAAGKGGAVSLEAGASSGGVAPSMNVSRDANGKLVATNPVPAGQAALSVPLVDLQSGSKIDLSVAASAVPLRAGDKYTFFLGSGPGDIISADTSGKVVNTDGTVVVAFTAGVVPAVAPGNSVVLDTKGQLTFLVDTSKGTATGTLHLRAPQAQGVTVGSGLTSTTLPPDVQVNPIDGTVINPSSLVVEGYRTYTPNAGYVDSVEADIDNDGRVFASGKNTQDILKTLTKDWGRTLNPTLSTAVGAQLHLRPGAEVVSSTAVTTSTAVTLSTVGTNSKVDVATAGTTLILPSTAGSSPAPSALTNQLLFSTTVTLTAVDTGNYFYNRPFTSSDLTGLLVTTGTVVAPTTTSTTIAANRLTSDVDFKVTLLNGNSTTYPKGPVPVLAAGSVLTFLGAGTVKLNGTIAVTAKVTQKLAAGVAVDLPAQSTVNLTTKGGRVTFTGAGSLTYQGRSNAANTLAVQAADGSAITTGVSPSSLLVGEGSVLQLKRAATSVDTPANTRVDLPLGLSGGKISIDASGTAPASTFTVTLTPTQGGTVALSQGGTLTTKKGGAVSIDTTVDTVAGASFSSAGTLTIKADTATVSLVSSIPGTVTRTASLDAGDPGVSFTSAGGAITLVTAADANTLISTSQIHVLTSTGAELGTYQANQPLPALPSGSVLKIGGAGVVTTTSLSTLNVVVANPLPASTTASVVSGSVISLSGLGTIKAMDTGFAATVTDTLAPETLLTLAATDTVRLLNGSDRVSVKTTGQITLAGSGALSLSSDTQSKIAVVSLPINASITVASKANTSFNVSGAVTLAGGSNSGDLTLANTWDLSTYRYGPKVDPTRAGSGEPGILTLRAAGNLVFNGANPATKASLSDGFGPSPSAANGGLWQAPLLPAGAQSWSYRLVGGSDLAAADFQNVLPLEKLSPGTGSVLIGLGATALPSSAASRIVRVPQFYQTIRTGTGDITVASGRDVQLLNSLATIYTAGTQVVNPTSLLQSGDFDLPNTNYRSTFAAGQQFSNPYPVQYSLGGGDLTLWAQNNIIHLVSDSKTGVLLPDSSKEMPTNWLYRRGYVDPDTGEFGSINTIDTSQNRTQEIASTSWWIDFSNFFQGVGTLGGGNVVLSAGGTVTNVDAVAATNARMTKQATGGSKVAGQQHLVELGGGDLMVQAGANIDAGVYYVERGDGRLVAGDTITTNATRTTLTKVLQTAFTPGSSPDPITWLPTTLFLGKGSFELKATGDVLIGAVSNPFLLPQGVNNSLYQRTYFSTAPSSNSLRIESLQGNVTFKEGVTDNARDAIAGTLAGWYNNQLFNTPPDNYASDWQPWLRLAEPGKAPSGSLGLKTAANILPGFVEADAFAGGVALVNQLTLAPSANGSLNMFAAKSVEGLSVVALGNLGLPYNAVSNPYQWAASVVGLSDADPASIPSPYTPRGIYTDTKTISPTLGIDIALANFASLFADSGATTGQNVVLQTEQALHGQNPDRSASSDERALHGSDPDPVHLYAETGDISGLRLFSSKAARVSAGHDITDIGLYLQNARPDSTSVVSAGRDLIAYDPNSSEQLKGRSAGNQLLPGVSLQSGDIQISGPGALEVFAGHNIDLGPPIDRSSGAGDGTGVGIASIGNTRNPNLPFQGASVTVGAGVGSIGDLESGLLNFTDPVYRAGFIDRFLNPSIGGELAADHLPELGALLGFTIDPNNPQAQNATIWQTFNDPVRVSSDRRNELALNVFYNVLRDAGRNHNNQDRPGFGNYNDGYAAIATLFNGSFDFSSFIAKFITTLDTTRSSRYVPELGKFLPGQSGASSQAILDTFNKTLSTSERNRLAAQIFALALRDAQPANSKVSGNFTAKDVIDTVYPASSGGNSAPTKGDILLSSREIRTTNGGNISLFAPSGGLSLGRTLETKTSGTPPGIITQFGGNVSIFARDSVEVGVSRIFTLRGGDVTIWSSTGDIAAGSSSKTIQSAPPTRVLIDPQSANVKTDLAGLATGGGIGVLATVEGVRAGDVDLIAPTGTVDAGDAGIRATGNLNIAAFQVANVGNIQVGGATTGTPPPPAPPNIGGLTSAATASGAAANAATEAVKQPGTSNQVTELPSLITVEVLGYGGGEGTGVSPGDDNKLDSIPAAPPDLPPGSSSTNDEEEKRKRRGRPGDQVEINPGSSSPSPATT